MKNPNYREHAMPLTCETCKDARWVAGDDGHHGKNLVKCPRCGCSCPKREEGEPPLTRAEQCLGCQWRDQRWHELKRADFPKLRRSDLTPKQAELYANFIALGDDELDALRHIEGAEYDPSKDPEVLRELFEMGITYPPTEKSGQTGPVYPAKVLRSIPGPTPSRLPVVVARVPAIAPPDEEP